MRDDSAAIPYFERLQYHPLGDRSIDTPKSDTTNPVLRLPDAVVFDMDGTLLDTESIGIRAWIAAFAEHGVDIDRETAILPIGCDHERARVVLREAIGPGPDYEAIQALCSRLFHQIAAHEGIALKRGARAILSTLKEQRIPIGLATSTRKTTAMPELAQCGLLEFFDATVFGDEVVLRKPAPEIYLEAVRRLGFAPSRRIWAVEDSTNGILAAHAAGLTVVFVPDLQVPSAPTQAFATETHPNLESLAARFGQDGTLLPASI